MEFELVGRQLPVVSCNLKKGEKMVTEAGGMCWMDDAFTMESNTRGGLMKGLTRAISGESIFMTTYTCEKNEASISFGSSFPGCIMPVQLAEGKCLILQKSAFLAAEDSVTIEAHLNKKLGAGLFGGEGFVLQRIIGPGQAFLEIDGDVIEKKLGDGEVLKVDQGYIAAFEDTINFDITTIKGLKNKFFSGEGMFIATLTGPGTVWLQTMPFNVVAHRMIAMIPTK